MDNIKKKYNAYLKENYTIIDANKIDALANLKISNIRLVDYDIFGNSNNVIKYVRTDINNPLTLNDGELFINPDYYEKNRQKINDILCSYFRNCEEEFITICDSDLINDDVIDSIVSNQNMKKVELKEYTLTVEDYHKFKAANIKIDSKDVCDELKENFDEIIQYNCNRPLLHFNRYEHLLTSANISIGSSLTNEELENLKYINSDAEIVLAIDDYEYILPICTRLKELNKSNVITIKIKDKKKFNEVILGNRLDGDNIYVKTPNYETVPLKDYLRGEQKLYDMIKGAEKLSPFEKYVYAYNAVKQFKKYKENENDKMSARNLYQLLENDYMVCVGYSVLFGDLLDKLNIENTELSAGVDTSYDDVDQNETNFDKAILTNCHGHSRRYVHLVDQKYGIDGYYVSDPTWDNDLELDYYNYMILTDEEVSVAKRYLHMSMNEIFNVHTINEFIEKFEAIIKHPRYDYQELFANINFGISTLEKIDTEAYDRLKSKYSFIGESSREWPDDLTDLIYDLGNEIVSKVNKPLDGNLIFKAVENLYRTAYGYSGEALDTKMKEIREINAKRQEIAFPKRYKINIDGEMEVYMNAENKFDNGISR